LPVRTRLASASRAFVGRVGADLDRVWVAGSLETANPPQNLRVGRSGFDVGRFAWVDEGELGYPLFSSIFV